MTHKEFFEIAKEQPWKTIECETGKECWCRMIVTDPPVDDHYVASWGTINNDTAEYIVEIHNLFLNEQSLKDYVLNNDIVRLDDFDTDAMCTYLDMEGYYVFDSELDIQTYVEDDMRCYVFECEDDVFEYSRDNDSKYNKLSLNNSKSIAGFKYEDTIELINELAETKGWQWIYNKLSE